MSAVRPPDFYYKCYSRHPLSAIHAQNPGRAVSLNRDISRRKLPSI